METRSGRLWLPWAVVVVGFVLAQPVRALSSVDSTDFVAFLTGARLLGTDPECLYCSPAQLQAQTAVLGHAPTIGLDQFVNPPLAAFLLRPLTLIPVELALLLWVVISIVALGLAVAVVWRRLPGELAALRLPLACGATVLPGVAASLAYGQWDAVALLAAVVAVDLLLRHGDSVAAGLLLATLAVKPQLIFLALPALAISRCWRTLAGLSAGLALWAISTVVLIGPRGASTWVREVLPMRVGEAGKAVGLPGLVAQVGGSATIAFAGAAGMAAIAVALLWRCRQALVGNPAIAAALGITASVVCSPHVFAGDVALIGVLLGIEARRSPTTVWMTAVTLGAATVVDSAWPPLHAQAIVATAILGHRLLGSARPRGATRLAAGETALA